MVKQDSNLEREIWGGLLRPVLEKMGWLPFLRKCHARVYQLLPNKTVDGTINGVRAQFSVTSYSERIAVNQAMDEERPIIQKLLEESKESDVFWDVGANIGTHTCFIGKRLPNGAVIAFEPFEKNVQSLKGNIKLNEVPATIQQIALSHSSGLNDFYVPFTDSPGASQGSLNPQYKSSVVTTETVQTKSGDELVEKGTAPPPTLMKIDVESAAPSVIKGMSTTLKNHECRFILVEPHGNASEIRELLKQLGYTTDTLYYTRSADFDDYSIIARPTR